MGKNTIEKIINNNNQSIKIHKSYHYPDFSSESILTKEPWEYVTHFLNTKVKENKEIDHIEEAIYFWEQGKNLYKLSSQANSVTKPLLLYYCFLNTTKALLAYNKALYETDEKSLHHGIRQLSPSIKENIFNSLKSNSSPYLGLTSFEDIQQRAVFQNNTNKTNLKDIYVYFTQSKGVIAKLAKYLDNQKDLPILFSLDQLVSNLVFVHRAYSLNRGLSIRDQLFIPLEEAVFVTKTENQIKYFGFSASLDSKYASEIDEHNFNNYNFEKLSSKKLLILDKNREVTGENFYKKNSEFIKFIRKNHQYIAGSEFRWYLTKKKTSKIENLELNPLVILLAVFHCLSELTRYNPLKLRNMLDPKKNNESWLLYELIEGAGFQFIDLIASEITGKVFKIPRSY